MKDICPTCGWKKDKFSIEWGYSQCESCSMDDYFKN